MTFRKLGDLTGHAGRVDGLAFDRSGVRLASVSPDRTLRLWDVPSRRQLALLPVENHDHWRGAAPAFSPDGKTLAVPGVPELRLLDAATHAPLAALHAHATWVGPCTFSPDGALLALGGGAPAELIVWDVAARRERYRLRVWTAVAAFSPDNRLLAVATEGDALLLDAATGREVLRLRGHTGPVHDVAWAPGGGFLASAGADQVVRVWDAKTGRERRVFRGHTAVVHRVAYHPDGRRLVSGDAAGVLKMWDADRDQQALVLPYHKDCRGVVFTADGGQVRAVTPGGFRGWDVTTGRPAFERRAAIGGRAEWPLPYIALSADGRLCAGPDPANPAAVRVWDVETGETVLTLAGHRTGVRSVAFSPDGRRLASASGEIEGSEPRELFVWQLPERGRGDAMRTEFACESPVQSLAFGADGLTLVAGERGTFVAPRTPWKDGHVSVWDVATGRQLRRWPAHSSSVQSVAVDPTGRWVASAGRSPDQAVRVWNARTGELLHDFLGPTALTCVAFNPDGTRLAAVGYEGTVQLWDPAAGLDVLTLRGPSVPEGRANETRVAFSPDGTRLAVNSWTAAVHVWDARPLAGR